MVEYLIRILNKIIVKKRANQLKINALSIIIRREREKKKKGQSKFKVNLVNIYEK